MANLILFGAVLLCIEFNVAVSITIGLTVVTLLLFWMRGVFSKKSLRNKVRNAVGCNRRKWVCRKGALLRS